MAIKLWLIGTATLAAGALAAALTTSLAAAGSEGVDHLNRSRSLAALGSEPQCEAYSGLPAHWRSDAQAGMVHLHGGEFVLGSSAGYEDERPAGDGKTKVGGFWIDQTDVTNAQFASFVKATGYISDAERQGGGAVFHQPTLEELNARDRKSVV